MEEMLFFQRSFGALNDGDEERSIQSLSANTLEGLTARRVVGDEQYLIQSSEFVQQDC